MCLKTVVLDIIGLLKCKINYIFRLLHSSKENSSFWLMCKVLDSNIKKKKTRENSTCPKNLGDQFLSYISFHLGVLLQISAFVYSKIMLKIIQKPVFVSLHSNSYPVPVTAVLFNVFLNFVHLSNPDSICKSILFTPLSCYLDYTILSRLIY